MGRITALFARKVAAAAGDEIDQKAFLASVGLAMRSEAAIAEMLTADAYYDFFERVARALPSGVDLPLRTGASMRCDDYGAFGLAWKAAPTLRASFARSERYAKLLTSVADYEVIPNDQGALMVLHRNGERRLGLRLSNEATMASIVSMIRQVSPAPFAPLEVMFKHRAPPSIAAHETYFGCPVRFGAELDAMQIGPDDLVRPNRLGDEGITRFLIAHLDAELARLNADQSLEEIVRNAIARALSDGAPRMADVAKRLSMSERTLHRRLAEEGLTFQRLAENTRRALAEGLLRQSDYSLVEIAFLTGFSEQSAFNRAFRRWSDQTPSAFRDAHRSA
ncbi:MAG: AraC family transcriptional regulator [Neomegalonema sp.]|nr:AraC family transcriptional regulator [Neomegalonema sp.]